MALWFSLSFPNSALNPDPSSHLYKITEILPKKCPGELESPVPAPTDSVLSLAELDRGIQQGLCWEKNHFPVLFVTQTGQEKKKKKQPKLKLFPSFPLPTFPVAKWKRETPQRSLKQKFPEVFLKSVQLLTRLKDRKKLLFKTLFFNLQNCSVLGGKNLLGLVASTPWISITHPGPEVFCAPLWALAAPAGPQVCDTNPGKLPGNSTTSPLLLTDFLIQTDHMKQPHHSSRNFPYHPGEGLGTPFSHGGDTWCESVTSVRQSWLWNHPKAVRAKTHKVLWSLIILTGWL